MCNVNVVVVLSVSCLERVCPFPHHPGAVPNCQKKQGCVTPRAHLALRHHEFLHPSCVIFGLFGMYRMDSIYAT